MDAEGHKQKSQGGNQQMSKKHNNKDLEELRTNLNRLMLNMQQKAQGCWRYE
jgi:hypothetical protein